MPVTTLRELTGAVLALVVIGLSCGGMALAQTDAGQVTSDSAISDSEPGERSTALVPPENAAIAAELSARIAAANTEALRKRLAGIEAHYALNDYKPIWIVGNGPADRAAELVEMLNSAADDGLRPEDYDAAELVGKLEANGEQALADLEIHLSTAAVSYAQHMNAGRLNPRQVNREIVIYPDTISAEVILGDLRNTTSQKAYFRLLAPHTPRYERLRSALAVYRRIEAEGGWTTVADGDVIKPDGMDERMPAIRRRMREAGVYKGSVPEPAQAQTVADSEGGSASRADDQQEANIDPRLVYDAELVAAVTEFQQRSGLAMDGVIGPATIEAMNVPVSDRISTMIVNMERNRWMQNDFGPYHILANLADQVVKVVRNGDTIHAEVIQVGQPYHRTPVFSDEMEYIEMNPYWNVPVSIAVNEYLPKLRRNPGVLAAQNIDLLANGNAISAHAVSWSSFGKGNFPFRLRQRPGPGNALGRIKFMFPNQFNVYLHDTPSKSKFNATQRYFSHGCLRLRDPLKMAEVLLGPEGWSRDRIDATIASGKRTVVKLEKTIPVHVVYITTFVNKDGSVHFREDVYGRDKILAEALQKVRGR